ncbi:MAG: FHA domain-containing protein [Nannocystaceae bacterium]
MASFTLHIQYVDRPPETRTFADRDRITLGRDIGDIALRDSQVSGRHGEITFQAGVLRYVDLGSTNGSFLLDGRRVSTIEMTPGMAIRLGNSLITVQMIDSPLAGKGRTMIAGGGVAPFGFPGGGMPPPGGMPAQSGGTMTGEAGQDGHGLAYAPTSAMPAAMPEGFAPPVAQPPGAPPPGFPRPPTPVAPAAEPEDFDGAPTNPGGPGVPATAATGVPGVPAPTAPAGGAINVEDFSALYKQAWEFIKPVLVPASLIVGGITVPVALAAGILGFIPVVGGVLSALLNLAQALLMPLAIAALTRFLLGMHLNQPVDWMTAWKQQIANVKMIWLSFFVAGLIAAVGAIFLIIPGILLGAFIGPIYFCEGKRMVDINMRNLEITKQDPLLPIITFIVAAIAAALVIALPMWILGLIPFIGGLLASVLSAAVTAVFLPFMISLSIILYFRLRRRFEGGEPEIGAMQMLIATTAALPQESGAEG